MDMEKSIENVEYTVNRMKEGFQKAEDVNTLAELFDVMKLEHLDHDVSIAELVQAYAIVCYDMEKETLTHSNVAQGTHIDVASGNDIVRHGADEYTVQWYINKLLQNRNREMPILLSAWHADDLRGIAEEDDIKIELSDKECVDMFRSLDMNHDAEVGINWESIRYAVESLADEKKAQKRFLTLCDNASIVTVYDDSPTADVESAYHDIEYILNDETDDSSWGVYFGGDCIIDESNIHLVKPVRGKDNAYTFGSQMWHLYGSVIN